MAESDGFSPRPPDDRPGDPSHRTPYDRPEGVSPGAGPPADLPPLPDDLPGLLASLGTHLERHSAEELVVLLRDELERRELRAYAAGWRDAAAQYQRALDETASAARARSLRRVGRRPGRGEVIPLRPRTPPDEEEVSGAEEPEPPPDAPPGTPGLVPKSPHSRVPTIPRLAAPRRERGRGAAESPDEGPG
ncbi:hypothetical protein [Streptomyces sp. BPTC-684]|uniref:hypothetical protein n=1 Tax=Streptomyces sp. BPTC-684 TaxID=3043734 RepID=UPI0024B07C7A|nr:hypothetical protein [Streptomyces sp. BPTC-684]WHM37179.1 hypothetical protein QIY60_09880 [Streptomyces sp. BPTC-684]